MKNGEITHNAESVRIEVRVYPTEGDGRWSGWIAHGDGSSVSGDSPNQAIDNWKRQQMLNRRSSDARFVSGKYISTWVPEGELNGG